MRPREGNLACMQPCWNVRPGLHAAARMHTPMLLTRPCCSAFPHRAKGCRAALLARTAQKAALLARTAQKAAVHARPLAVFPTS
eukprot:143706-Chlamydomonas_euryale.AAC.1